MRADAGGARSPVPAVGYLQTCDLKDNVTAHAASLVATF
jgi:hypothetical protein